MGRPRPVVVIHGVNSAGDWYDAVEAVLGKHFEWVPIHYDGYRSRGKLKLVLFRGALGAALFLILGALGSWIWLPSFQVWLSTTLLLGCLAAVISLLAASLQERRRREKTVEFVASQIRAVVQETICRPHVIAHSFGTYLIARVLSKYHDLRPHCIILTGSILPRQYPWVRICWAHARDVASFKDVRNEMGLADDVVRMASWGRWLIGGCGSSGRDGFLPPALADLPQRLQRESALFVHNVEWPLGPCEECEGRRGGKPKLHNIPLEHYAHDFPAHHAREMWLPVFWDLEPCDYVRFCETAVDVDMLPLNWDDEETREKLEEIGRESYGWTCLRFGRRATVQLPLADYVELVLQGELDRRSKVVPAERIEPLVQQTIRRTCRLARCALSKRADGELAKLSYPRRAVRAAAALVAAELQH